MLSTCISWTQLADPCARLQSWVMCLHSSGTAHQVDEERCQRCSFTNSKTLLLCWGEHFLRKHYISSQTLPLDCIQTSSNLTPTPFSVPSNIPIYLLFQCLCGERNHGSVCQCNCELSHGLHLYWNQWYPLFLCQGCRKGLDFRTVFLIRSSYWTYNMC